MAIGFGMGQGGASAEIEALRKADQAARQFTAPPPRDVIERLKTADLARENRIRELLREDKVVTAADLDAAALIMQHGEDPEDYELARELSILAFSKGKPGTLQTAAEDRFLLSIGQKQRFGNQFGFDEGGKLVFRELDETPPAAVTDGLRAEFLVAPVELIRAEGLQAFGKAIPQLAERFQKNVSPEFVSRWDKLPTSQELAALAKRHADHGYDVRGATRVLELYRSGALATPANFENAARVLMTSSEVRMVLLANEMAAVSVSRKRASACSAFTRSWDKFLVILGRPDRYGTVSGAHRVSPVVAREFGVAPLLRRRKA